MNLCFKSLIFGGLMVTSVVNASIKPSVGVMGEYIVKSDSLIRRIPTDSLVAVQERRLAKSKKILSANVAKLEDLKKLNDQKIKELKDIERRKTTSSAEYAAKADEIIALGATIERVGKSEKLPEISDKSWGLEEVKVLKGLDWNKLKEKSSELLKGLDLQKLQGKSLEELFKGKNWKDITLGEAQDKAVDVAGKVKSKLEEAAKKAKKEAPKLSAKDQKSLDALNKELEELSKKRDELLKKKGKIVQPQIENYMDLGSGIFKSFGDVLGDNSVTIIQNGKVLNDEKGEVKYYLNSKEITKEQYDAIDPKSIIKRSSSVTIRGNDKITKIDVLTK